MLRLHRLDIRVSADELERYQEVAQVRKQSISMLVRTHLDSLWDQMQVSEPVRGVEPLVPSHAEITADVELPEEVYTRDLCGLDELIVARFVEDETGRSWYGLSAQEQSAAARRLAELG